jgi:hypothetical protein
MSKLHLSGKAKVLLVGAAVAGIALTGAGLAIAADTGQPTTVTVREVPGAKPDLSKVKPGVAIPLGPVSPDQLSGSGVTTTK